MPKLIKLKKCNKTEFKIELKKERESKTIN